MDNTIKYYLKTLLPIITVGAFQDLWSHCFLFGFPPPLTFVSVFFFLATDSRQTKLAAV